MRRRPRVFLWCQHPMILTLALPPPHPLLAVSGATSSETRVPPRLRQSSKRRESPSLSAPPPDSVRFLCQLPLTRLSHHPHPTPRSQSPRQQHRIRGRLCVRCHPQRDKDNQPGVRRPRVFAFMSAPVDTCLSLTGPAPCLQFGRQQTHQQG